MRFGGHETFAIREGWLHKGLTLLAEEPEQLEAKYVADTLGVGRNMAKSIKHWLIATGLADRPLVPGSRKRGPMEMTRFGRLVLDRDPYFIERGTWAALHVNLVSNTEHAATWHWFFNHFLHVRFERATCNEVLRRYLAINEKKQPSPKTLQRDVACLLSTYAQDVPPVASDPEDATESPFRELGLLIHFRDSGSYRREPGSVDGVDAEVLPYAILSAEETPQPSGDYVEISVRDACLAPSGPGRCFNFDLETFYEACLGASQLVGSDRFQVLNLAGERVIRFQGADKTSWLESYYLRQQSMIAA